MAALPPDPPLLRSTAAALPHDETFPAFVSAVRGRGAEVEVVSDGLGFYIVPALDALGVADVPVATNRIELDVSPPDVSFPFGHPRCFVCGTCKRERVRGHQAAGSFVVYIGDGVSDRYAAAYADLTFAKGELAELCAAEGWPHLPWERFADVTAWAERAYRTGFPEVPMGPADAMGPAVRGPAGRFICGPEVWGPDRTTPTRPPDPDAPGLRLR